MRQVLAVMVTVLTIVSVSYAGNVSKAKDFIKAGMYPQAIELLNKEISENPTNAEAHFELGSCYVNQGKYSAADERFASAVRLKADYGYKIGGIYKTAGLSAADKGQIDTASTLLNKAITYQPDVKAGLVSDMMNKGRAAVQQGKYDNADARFLIATSIEPTHKKEVCEMYGQLGNSASGENGVSFYNRASQYCNAYNGKAGNTYLELAKKMARTPGKDKERDSYKAKAANYLGSNIVEQEVPEFKEFGAGLHIIGKFKKGEQTPYWLAMLRGNYSFSFLTDETNKYIIITSSGDRFRMWDSKDRAAYLNKHFENERFKIEFDVDTDFGWELKQN